MPETSSEPAPAVDSSPPGSGGYQPAAFDDAAIARFYEALAGEGVRVANGLWFGDEPRVFRLGFGLLSMADLDAALAGLTGALRKALRKAA